MSWKMEKLSHKQIRNNKLYSFNQPQDCNPCKIFCGKNIFSNDPAGESFLKYLLSSRFS